MRYSILIASAIVLCFPHVSVADTLYLKSGKVAKVKILEKYPTYIIVQEGNAPNKYYSFQIERIEEDPVESTGNDALLQNVDLSKVEDKKELIKIFLEVNGTKTNLEKNFENILSRAEGDKKEKLKGILEIGKVMDLLIPIYDKYFSEDEIRELIKFYQSPAGQKLNGLAPVLMEETMQESIKYFKDADSLLNPSKN